MTPLETVLLIAVVVLCLIIIAGGLFFIGLMKAFENSLGIFFGWK